MRQRSNGASFWPRPLLSIELQCRRHGGGQLRSKVYTHLSSFLPCSRDTVLKRAKKLLLAHAGGGEGRAPDVRAAPPDWPGSVGEEPPDAGDPLLELRDAIGRAMPPQVARFHRTCRVHDQARSSR